MKKIIKSLIAVIAVTVITIAFMQYKEELQFSPLQIKNIEALTNNEGSVLDPDCPSGWKVECYRWYDESNHTTHIYYREYRSGEGEV